MKKTRGEVVRKLEYMPLSKLKPAEQNPKEHAQEDIGKSIGRFGYTEPVVLDERTGRLVAGHGRIESLRVRRAAKEKPPEGIQEKGGEWLVPVVRGWASRSDTEAKAYLLASNQLTISGGWDEADLGAMLKELGDSQALEGVGFNEAELGRMLASMAKMDPAGVEFPEYDESAAEGVEMVECPKCQHRFPK